MEASQGVVPVSSPSEAAIVSGGDSLLSNLLCDISQQVQAGMENMLKMINEIDQCSASIVVDLEKSKELAIERKKNLEDEKDCVQKAAFSVLEMLDGGDIRKAL